MLPLAPPCSSSPLAPASYFLLLALPLDAVATTHLTEWQAAGEPVPKVANVSGWLQHVCAAGMTGQQLYEKQDLFSIYVHRSPGVTGAPEDSIFYERDIEHRCGACSVTVSATLGVASAMGWHLLGGVDLH